MNTTTTEIIDLFDLVELNAPDMTHALKGIGDGDMQLGIHRIAMAFYLDGRVDGILIGEKAGVKKGAFYTTVFFSILFVSKYLLGKSKENKQQQVKIKEKEFLNN